MEVIEKLAKATGSALVELNELLLLEQAARKVLKSNACDFCSAGDRRLNEQGNHIDSAGHVFWDCPLAPIRLALDRIDALRQAREAEQ